MHYLRWMRPRVRGFSTRNVGLNPAHHLVGTAPFHDHYVMLHSRNPPREFPKAVSSPVQRALQLALAPSNGSVNFSWSPRQSLPPAPSSPDDEVYSATAFSKGGNVIELEGLTVSNIQEAVQRITSPRLMIHPGDTVRPLYIYVCTHAARDCRCGVIGSSVSEALRKEIDRRGLATIVKLGETGHVGGHKLGFLDSRPYTKPNWTALRYAANVLIYPKGEW